MSVMPLAFGLLPLMLQDASAFAPRDAAGVGLEPQRIHRVHPHLQVQLAQDEAWQAFLEGEGAGWQARFDEWTGTPRRMWGAGIDIGPTRTAAQVEAGLLAFVNRHPDVFGIEAGSTQTRVVKKVEDTWYVDIDVLVGGAPIYRGGLTARIKYGQLIFVGADTYRDTPVANAATLSGMDAVLRAISNGPAANAQHTEIERRRVVLPMLRDDALSLVHAWEVRSKTAQPLGHWVTMVDAESGDILNVHDEVRYVTGSVYGWHDERTVDGSALIESPMPLIEVSNGTDTVNADENGVFDLDDLGSGLLTVFNSSYVNISNEAGAQGQLDFDGNSPDVSFTDADATQAEISNYKHLNDIRAWGEIYAPNISWVRNSIRSDVNEDDACNAHYDGRVNFYLAGQGCNNTGRIADVAYHEWGHGFHDHSLVSGTFDGSISEGIADTVAFLQTDDHIIAPFFDTRGGGIRRVDRDRVYPDDFSPSAMAVHDNGLIFGGAMWDLLEILKAEGHADPHDQVSQILAGLVRGGPGIEGSFDEALVADDDDGDLANGTPTECQLIEAFGAHGLGPLGTGDIVLASHEPLVQVPAEVDAEVAMQAQSISPNCYDSALTDATVTWRLNGGDWQTDDIDLDADTAEGIIPAHQLGDYVEYYLTVTDDNNEQFNAPSGGRINPFTYYVGDVLPLDCEDFEVDDGGYTHELLAGEEREGADDWQHGRPLGMSGDPDQAHSGLAVWGNDLGGGEFNGAYQPDKHNRLSSRKYTYSPHYKGVFLHYWRWLNVEDNYYDKATILADDERVWTNWKSASTLSEDERNEHHEDTQWMPHTVDLKGNGDDGSVRFSWDIRSDAGLEFGGWTLDDVCVLAPATIDNRLGIGDFAASDEGGARITLTWTNPKHKPLAEVVVVRGANGFPEGPDDGVVVYRDTEPALGKAITTHDPDAPGSGYYAVYASDGKDWLGFTVEGLNADAGTGGQGKAELEGKGCGCSNTAPIGGWLLIGLGLVAARRRD